MDFDLGPAATTPQPAPQATLNSSPIADLSYRNYDGPLKSRFVRWWVVALAMVRLALKSPTYWIIFAICLLRYILECGSVYVTAQIQEQIPDPNATLQLRESFAHHLCSH